MTYIDIHVLQTVPPSNINRDDTGSPKTGLFGGVRRARVSSQAWKRAVRVYFRQHLDASQLGYRTKRIVELVTREIQSRGIGDEAHAEELAEKVLTAAKITLTKPKKRAPKKKAEEESEDPTAAQSEYLVFISTGQISNLAELAVAAENEGGPVAKNDAQAAFQADQSIDVALFGRMVADDAVLNVDAAAQVAHALGVSPVDNEFDYFTAIDDLQDEDHQTGAGMIGTVEFNSSTLYRYATLNVDGLLHNLGDPDATARAAATFVEAFIRSMPTGKQNTFANRTLPDAVVVIVRDDQPVNLVGAFEDPIRPKPMESVVISAAKKLALHSKELNAAYGTPIGSWTSGPASVTEHLADMGPCVPVTDLVTTVNDVVTDALRRTP
ncbi:MAG: type I-E CRISPR-associated protein Cas7/Cse4/CasC [Mycolicibacterium sp.]|nr:type I-E CRISPR-associated protein Cas7/Cse4/CasC [Mycolicibacterium sp.]